MLQITNFYVTALCHFCLSFSFYNSNRKNNNCFIINFYSIIIIVCNWRSFFRFSVVAIFVVVAAAEQTLRFDEKLENLKNSFIFRGHKLSWMACFNILPPLRFVVDQFWKILPIKKFTERTKNCETAKVSDHASSFVESKFLEQLFQKCWSKFGSSYSWSGIKFLGSFNQYNIFSIKSSKLLI